MENLALKACAEFGLIPKKVIRQDHCKNPVYRIESDGSVFVLKSHMSVEQVEAVLHKLDYLAEQGFIAMPQYLVSRSRSKVVTVDKTNWTLAKWIESDDTVSITEQKCANLIAEVLGQFHQKASGAKVLKFSGEKRPGYGMARIANIIKLCNFVINLTEFSEKTAFAKGLNEVLPLYKKEAEKVLATMSQSGFMHNWQIFAKEDQLIHGDISRPNIVMSDPETVYLLDWDGLRPGVRVEGDLVQLFWRIAWFTSDSGEVMERYHQIAPLSAEELAVFPVLASPVHTFAYCAKRLTSGELTSEDENLARELLKNVEQAIRAPWEVSSRLTVK